MQVGLIASCLNKPCGQLQFFSVIGNLFFNSSVSAKVLYRMGIAVIKQWQTVFMFCVNNYTWNNKLVNMWTAFVFRATRICQQLSIMLVLKPLVPFRYRKKKKNHRFTNNLQGLQKVVVKDFSWNIIPWNALLFEKTLKQYQFSISRITDLF